MEQPQQVEAIKGACLMVRRAALEEVGLLDEGYFMYTEEVDLLPAGRAGWELWFVPHGCDHPLWRRQPASGRAHVPATLSQQGAIFSQIRR